MLIIDRYIKDAQSSQLQSIIFLSELLSIYYNIPSVVGCNI